jgi:glucan phosphoethanolaminetransferase (alkaline phosphatase superfamily)
MSYYYYDSSIDTWMDYKELAAFGPQYDSRILPALDSLNLDYSQKQFIVIHHRNAHLPYKANYPKDFDIFKPKSNSRLDTEKAAYDNSILFLDTTMANLYSYFESNTKSNTAVLYTSDHGELFGLDGIWGHIRLHPAVARVPVLTYGINLTDKIKDSLPTTQRCASTHYDVARSTAKLLGWDISSSEFNPDVAYVNGLDINGSDGYLTIDIKEAYPTSCENNDIQTKPLNSNH